MSGKRANERKIRTKVLRRRRRRRFPRDLVICSGSRALSRRDLIYIFIIRSDAFITRTENYMPLYRRSGQSCSCSRLSAPLNHYNHAIIALAKLK